MSAAADILSAAMAHPQETLWELDRLDAEASLRNYAKLCWHELEPSTQLKWDWPLDAICDLLEATVTGDVTRALINVPPGFMKSMLTSVFMPTWVWGPKDKAHMRFIATSYATELAIRDNTRARALINSETYQRHWGDRFNWSGDQNQKTRYENDAKGWRQSAGTGSALTGHRGDFLIIDDPHSVKSAESEAERNDTLFWFSETVPTRLNDLDESRIIVIMQRLHEQDVSGLILEKELGYEHLMVPMRYEEKRKCYLDCIDFEDPRTEEGELAFPDRFNEEAVSSLEESFRSVGGEYAAAGQLQQNPIPRDGGMFQEDDFRIIECLPDDVMHSARGWDLAATKDGFGAQTAGVLMHKCRSGLIVIEDVRAGRWSDNEVRERLQGTARADGHGVHQDLPQDPGQAGKAQKSDLGKYLDGYPFSFSPESGSKEDRARPLSAQCEAGNVALVRGTWNDSFIAEATSFPKGKLKDKVDAASRAHARLVAMSKLSTTPTSGGRSFGG